MTWIGAELKKEIAQKNKLLAISKRYPTEGNKRAYKSARNIVISKLRKVERKHYDDQLDLYGNDNHKKWKVIKEIIAKEDRSSTMQSEFIIDTPILKLLQIHLMISLLMLAKILLKI